MAISFGQQCCSDAQAKKKWLIIGGSSAAVLLVVIIIVVAVTVGGGPLIGSDVLKEVPLIDGHNDLAWNLYKILRNDMSSFNFSSDLTAIPAWNVATTHTDLPRLKKGMVGGQFWAAYAPCTTNYRDAVARTLDQIDVIKRLVVNYNEDLEFVTSSEGIMHAFKTSKKIASLIGVEGGHSIDSRMGVLRLYYELGVRYLTLTHNCNLPWATTHQMDMPENATLPNGGLSAWGKDLIKEMNRLGMIVDLAHVSKKVMSDALEVSRAPVMFSHSSSASVFPEATRNVPDDILMRLRANKGIIMINFYSGFISTTNSTIEKVIDHLEHIRTLHGSADHIGLGADYDGVDKPVTGLEDVSKYPDLFDKLAERGWNREELRKLAGENIIRVLKAVEDFRDTQHDVKPYEAVIPVADLLASDQLDTCREDFSRAPPTTETGNNN